MGRSLCGRKCCGEFSAFLEWLSTIIESEHIDALLVAFDVPAENRVELTSSYEEIVKNLLEEDQNAE